MRTGGSDDEPGTEPRRWVLVVLRHGAIEEHALPARGALRIGREEQAEIRIDQRSVSRFHARIEVTSDDGVTITDLGSRNGTTIAGLAVGDEPVVVGEGQTVFVGDVACHLMAGRRTELRSDLRVEPAELERRLVYEAERALRTGQTASTMVVLLGEGEPARLQRAQVAVIAALRDLDVYAVRGPDRLDVMLVDTDRAAARATAERIAGAVESARHRARIGVASFPGDAPTSGLLGQAAEMAARGGSGHGVFVAQDAIRVLRFADREVVVSDRAMHRVFGIIERVAPAELSVLVCGETGTGKELAAHALHALGPRRQRPLVAVNCAALPENLLESELFGHERGAFSGAVVAKAGLFEEADGGTIFLDEIGEMPPALQAKLLRVLETKTLRRVGGSDERRVDVRVVSATHRDLDHRVESGEFRQDLLFRLRGIRIDLPPLRDRPHEIAILATRFLAEACRAAGREPLAIGTAAAEVLARYRWPGNVRELRHAMSSAAVMAEGAEVAVEDLPDTVRGEARSSEPPRSPIDPDALPLDEAVRAYERARIESALDQTNGNQSHAARLLGIPRRTLVSKLKALGIRRASAHD